MVKLLCTPRFKVDKYYDRNQLISIDKVNCKRCSKMGVIRGDSTPISNVVGRCGGAEGNGVWCRLVISTAASSLAVWKSGASLSCRLGLLPSYAAQPIWQVKQLPYHHGRPQDFFPGVGKLGGMETSPQRGSGGGALGV